MDYLKHFISLDHRRLRKLGKILSKINALKSEMRQLSDEQLKAKTDDFRERLNNGSHIDEILVEAYAVVREACYRILGKFPYDVQVLGAIVLHQGNTAEMKTGEGKTLTATMPLYLNALQGKGAMLITNSDYLAIRDADEMGPVFNFLGLSVDVGVFINPKQKVTEEEKKKIYQADILYTTNSALGFDYLIDNLAPTPDKKFMRSLHYAIIDEADSILLDMAQTPLIISGSPRVQSNLYKVTDDFIKGLQKYEDYYFDSDYDEIWMKQQGIDEAERFFSRENLYSLENKELVRHLNLALQAHHLHERGKDYVIDDDEVKLLDKANGRMLAGTRLQGGVHQAIEQKENVKVSPKMRAIASITYQNLFLLFEKLAGMTGTGKTVEDEFIETFNMEVVQIPTNKPVQRIDYPDKIYTTLPEKINAIIQFVRKVHKTGQPILLVTGSVRMSKLFSELMLLEEIPHNLLNAQNAAKEAQMISEAGQKYALTVATNMAGRGTDIKLGDGVAELGGLMVIGTERMISKRMDLQLRGRSGRQGDPGSSQFFVCLEDDLMTKFGPKWTSHYFKNKRLNIDEFHPKLLEKKRFKKAFDIAQEMGENQGKSSRANTLSFAESVKIQRSIVYKEREKLLNNSDNEIEIDKIINFTINQFLNDNSVTITSIQRFVLENMTYDFTKLPNEIDLENDKKVRKYLVRLAESILSEKKTTLGINYLEFVRQAVLKAIDESWVEEVDYLQQLQTVAISRRSAQRNPIFEYHKEALLSYDLMREEIQKLIFKYLLLSKVSYGKKGELIIHFI